MNCGKDPDRIEEGAFGHLFFGTRSFSVKIKKPVFKKQTEYRMQTEYMKQNSYERTDRRLVIVCALLLLLCGCGKNTVAEEAEKQEVPMKETPVITVIQQPDEGTSGPGREETAKETEAEEILKEPDPAEAFYMTEITDEIFERIKGKSFKDDCTLPREDLRYLHVLHKTKDGQTMEGELIVNVHIADTVLDIFRKLYEADYPIEKIRLVDEYGADDDLSMADNNTSCFNYRVVEGTNHISKHGRGLAIDLNPLYNPYVHKLNGVEVVSPENGEQYADRSLDFDYKIDENDLAYKLFTGNGFNWGGAWKNEKDYQHFEIPSEQIKAWY